MGNFQGGVARLLLADEPVICETSSQKQDAASDDYAVHAATFYLYAVINSSLRGGMTADVIARRFRRKVCCECEHGCRRKLHTPKAATVVESESRGSLTPGLSTAISSVVLPNGVFKFSH